MATIPGIEVGPERPWRPGLDDDLFSRPRNPNFNTATSPQAAEWQRTRAAPPTPPAPSLRDGFSGARTGAAQARAGRVATDAATAAATPQPGRLKRGALMGGKLLGAAGALSSLGNYRINDPDVDSSAMGTLRALGSGDFAGAGRSLSKGALELGMDLASAGAGVVDSFAGAVGGRPDLSGRLDRSLRSQFGDQLVSAGGDQPPGVVGRMGAQTVAAPTQPQSAQPATNPVAPPPSLRNQVYAENGVINPNVIVRDGNSYSGTQVGPDAQLVQRMGNGQLSLRDFGGGNVSNGVSSGAASAQRVADIYKGMAYGDGGPGRSLPQAPEVLHSGNSWSRRNDLRSAEISAKALRGEWDLYRDGAIDRNGRPTKTGGANPAAMKYAAMLQADGAARGDEAKTNLGTLQSNNTLRGAWDTNDARRFGDVMSARGTAEAARLKAIGDADKRASDDAIRQNDQDIKNSDRTRERFSVFDRETGKRDEQATNDALLALDKIAPGFSRMGEDARGKALPQADALFKIYQRTAGNKELGLGQAVFGNKNPRRDAMPNFKGGVLKRSGLAGALPGGAGVNGYFIEMPDGREVALGQNLSENELALLRRNIETGSWKD